MFFRRFWHLTCILGAQIFLTIFFVCTFQATAEQMRLAQVIFDKNDSEFEAKVKQVYLWQRILLFWQYNLPSY